MTPKEYQKLALRTEPSEEQYKAVADRLSNLDTANTLNQIIIECIKTLHDLDVLKKHIFYGKENKIMTISRRNVPDTAMEKLNDLKTIRMLHAIVGLATEAGELLEMLRNHLIHDKEIDFVNGGEEFGDSQWYTAIGLDVCDMSFEHIMEKNIEKLAARYGEKFSDVKALNRDLETERKILEK